jgi:DNA-binding MarR family transcriptional regulator
MTDLEQRIGPYLRETLGAEVLPLPWAEASRLAPFLAERYRFFQASILDHPVLFMTDLSPSEESPANIRKHISQVHAKSDWPIIYVRDRVTAYNRKRLIEQRVPFVVPGNQMYLPDLGIDLREHFRKQVVTQPQFRPATQALVIHALLRDREGPLAATELAPELGYSSMTLSRAFDEIEAAELGESRPAGRERFLHFAAPRRELWKRAQPFLKDPVKARHFIQSPSIEGLGPSAGLSALARYSMLDDPKNQVVAMSREHWTSLRQRGAVTVLPMREPSAFEIETWSYAPRMYRQQGVVDPLSLYLSLRQSPEERVEQALGHMMESLPW